VHAQREGGGRESWATSVSIKQDIVGPFSISSCAPCLARLAEPRPWRSEREEEVAAQPAARAVHTRHFLSNTAIGRWAECAPGARCRITWQHPTSRRTISAAATRLPRRRTTLFHRVSMGACPGARKRHTGGARRRTTLATPDMTAGILSLSLSLSSSSNSSSNNNGPTKRDPAASPPLAVSRSTTMTSTRERA
ncbi:unnamed protein product, partial [Ectocarpus sp. 6 AP-2014]